MTHAISPALNEGVAGNVRGIDYGMVVICGLTCCFSNNFI